MRYSKIAICGLIIEVWILILLAGLFAQELPEFSRRVKVLVSAEEDISGEIESYIKRELRSLGDVLVVEDEEDYQLSIVALEDKLSGGQKIGVSLSIVILDSVDPSLYIVAFGEFLDKDKDGKINITRERERLNYYGLDRPTYRLSEHWLRTGPHEALRSICEGIVADFDTAVLEEARKLHQTAVEILKTEQKEEK